MADDPHPSALQGVFREPFAEQLAFFRQKLGRLVPTQRWDDLIGVEHDRAFMVAGAMKAELLTDLAAAVDKAIAEGQGIEAFRKDFRAIVARHGWTGWTGEGSIQGEAWRVRTIYRTNMYTSYAAGRFAQLKAQGFPFWVYRHGGSLEPRPQHLDWDGLVLPAEHPFWTTHYPPSDWGCSCYVLGSFTETGARRMGGQPGKKLPANWQAIDPKTGAPVGIGKGWNYAPGASVADTVAALAARIGSWDYRVAKAFMAEVPEAQRDLLAQAYRELPGTADEAGRIARRAIEEPSAKMPERTLGLLRTNQAQAVRENAEGFDFSITAERVRHIFREHGNASIEQARGQRAITADDFTRLPALLNIAVPRYVGRSDGFKRPVYETALIIDGDEYVARWEHWPRRKTMALLTFFVRTRIRG